MGMLGLSKVQTSNRTLLDLQIEKERLPWYYKLAANVSVWLIIAGFIAFQIAFDDQHERLRGSRTALNVVATCLLVVGYIFSLTMCFACESSLFLLDVVLIPSLGSSFLGLFNTILTVELRDLKPLKAVSITVLCISVVSIAFYAVTSILTYRRVYLVSESDRLRRQRNGGSYEPIKMPETEAQRQQLLRLLLKRDVDRAPTPEAAQNTFRIDIPDEGVGPSGESQYLALPSNTNPNMKASALATQRNSAGSWEMQQMQARWSRDSSSSTREQRRSQIERESIVHVDVEESKVLESRPSRGNLRIQTSSLNSNTMRYG